MPIFRGFPTFLTYVNKQLNYCNYNCMCAQLMCLLNHKSRPVPFSEIDDVFSTNFTFKLLSWSMGTCRNFRRRGGQARKRLPKWRKWLP